MVTQTSNLLRVQVYWQRPPQILGLLIGISHRWHTMLRLLVLILALASSSAYRSYLRANGRRLPVERGVLVHPNLFRAEYTMEGARKATRRLNMQGESAMKTAVHSGKRIFNSGIGSRRV